MKITFGWLDFAIAVCLVATVVFIGWSTNKISKCNDSGGVMLENYCIDKRKLDNILIH